MNIGVVGLSHLGTVTSICFASLGWDVVAVDADQTQVSASGEGHAFPHEPKLKELLGSAGSRLGFTTDFGSLRRCSVVCIGVDTEPRGSDTSSTQRLDETIARVVPHLSDGVALAVMSQIPVGFSRHLAESVKASRPGLNFELCHWVETLVIGNAVERCLHPERIIIGTDSGQPLNSEPFHRLLSRFSCPVLWMSYESAELTKQAINLYLATSLTVANTLADLCESSGADMREVVPALRQDRRIGQYAYLKPGLGFAGGNLERDLLRLSALGRRSGAEVGLVDYVLRYNAGRSAWVRRQLDRHIFPFVQVPRIGVWGLAYKKNTSSTLDSFAVRALKELAGKAELMAYDPAASLPPELDGTVSQCGRWEAASASDCLLVLTDWDEFADTDYQALRKGMKGPAVILDCVGIMDGRAAAAHGLRYVAVGASD